MSSDSIADCRFTAGDNTGFTDRLTSGEIIFINNLKRFRHPAAQAFNECMGRHNGVQGEIGQVYQMDFYVNDSGISDLFALFGVRLDSDFSVDPTIIYAFLNHTLTEGLNVQTFPSGNRRSITLRTWYTAKLRIQLDEVEVYISGGQEGYSNELIGTGAFPGIQDSIIYAQFNCAKTPDREQAQIDTDNFFVSMDLNFTPPDKPVDMDSCSFFTKESIR